LSALPNAAVSVVTDTWLDDMCIALYTAWEHVSYDPPPTNVH